MIKKTNKSEEQHKKSDGKIQRIREKTAKISKTIHAKKNAKKIVRITDANIEEQRHAVIAQGKKFKYPLQYSKHKILKISALIFVMAVLLSGFGVWYLLYNKKSTSDFSYRITQFLPLSVANVDGENVAYSDYLRRIRADLHYYEFFEKRDFNSSDGMREKAYYDRQQLTNAERTAYARKIAKLRKISITDQEIDQLIDKQKQIDKSSDRQLRETVEKYYDWTIADYREILRGQLLEKKVAFAIDRAANEKITKVKELLNKKNANFQKIAQENNEDEILKSSNYEIIVKTGESDIYGISEQIKNLKAGEISEILQVKDSNGNYAFSVVKVLDRDKENTKYAAIFVQLKQFSDDFSKLKKDGKIREYIKIPEAKK